MCPGRRSIARSATRNPPDPGCVYVPRVLVESLAAHPERRVPWHECVEGTLVMADISGFTAMSERLATAGKEGAEWLTAIINSYFGSMLDFAWDLGGTALTFGGDAMLLLFYGPDHAACAVLASMRMLEATTKLTSYRVGSHRIKLGMSMGAHSGQFLMASVGTTDRLQYLVLGPETVRTAGAESLAERGELAVTAETLEQLCGVETDERDGLYVVKSTGHVPDYRLDDQSSEFGSANPAALAPYLPPFVSTTLLEGKEITPPEQEHRKVTIVFVNVMGIDDLIGRAGPSCLVDEMQQYAECLTRLTHKNNGYLVSSDIYTDGCKFILAFGAPIAHEHDTVNAMRCITALRDEVQRMDLHLTHRIGINAGFVFAGDVGPSYRRQYTVMGDAVNLAARLMSAAVPGQIMASRSVVDEAESRFVVTDLAPVRREGQRGADPGLHSRRPSASVGNSRRNSRTICSAGTPRWRCSTGQRAMLRGRAGASRSLRVSRGSASPG